jgi:AP-1-like factor
MAGTATNDFQNGAPFYLDSKQQDLLLAALASNQQDPSALFPGMDSSNALAGSQFPYPVDAAFDPNFFASPQQTTPATGFSNGSLDESPFVDYIDGDHGFDFDGENGDLMIGALPGDSPKGKNGEDGTEKRKSPDDDAEDRDGGAKRREGEDKQAKKPGRKPLTSEPTTVGFPSFVAAWMHS